MSLIGTEFICDVLHLLHRTATPFQQEEKVGKCTFCSFEIPRPNGFENPVEAWGPAWLAFNVCLFED